MDLRFESFNPEYIISIVMNRTRPLASKKNILVKTELDPDLPDMIADANKVTEILYNLVENSLKFTYEGGSILISAKEDNGNILISVSDTGIGIKEDDFERIFEPFVQADGSTSRKHGGVGLGLMLARQYAKMHNGIVSVKSKYGKGSTFLMKLPTCPEYAQRKNSKN